MSGQEEFNSRQIKEGASLLGELMTQNASKALDALKRAQEIEKEIDLLDKEADEEKIKNLFTEFWKRIEEARELTTSILQGERDFGKWLGIYDDKDQSS